MKLAEENNEGNLPVLAQSGNPFMLDLVFDDGDSRPSCLLERSSSKNSIDGPPPTMGKKF